MILSLCLAILPFGRIATLSEVTVALASQIGQPIEIADNLKDDLVFVEPRSAPPRQVLAALAKTLQATVAGEGQLLSIRRTSDDERALRVKRTEARTDWIRKDLEAAEKYRTDNFKSSGPDVYLAEVRRLAKRRLEEVNQKLVPDSAWSPSDGLPAAGLLEGLIRRIGLDKLAELPSDEACVYEDEPVAGARSLPDVQDLKADYESAMAAFQNYDLTRDDLFNLKITGQGYNVAEWNESAHISRLRLSEEAGVNWIALTLEGYDSLGKRIVQARLAAGPDKNATWAGGLLRREACNPRTRWIDLAPDAPKEGQGAYALPDWTVHPDKIEPLNVLAKDVLTAIGDEHPEKSFVFAVSDRLWDVTAECSQNGKLNVDAFEDYAKQYGAYECLSQEDAIVWRLQDPEFEEQSRASRKELARFVVRFKSTNHIDTRSAVLLYHDANIECSRLTVGFLGYVGSSTGELPTIRASTSPKELFRLLGAIPDEAWSSLVSGRVLSCGSMGIVPDLDRFLRRAQLQTEGAGVSDLYRHPTELLPYGVTPDLTLKFEPGTTDMIKTLNPPGSSNPTANAWMQLFSFRKVTYQNVGFLGSSVTWNGDTPTFGVTREQFEQELGKVRYRFGEQPKLVVKIGLPHGLFAAVSVEEGIEPEAQSVAYADMPQALRDEVWSNACARILASLGRSRDIESGLIKGTRAGGSAAGGVIPPP